MSTSFCCQRQNLQLPVAMSSYFVGRYQLLLTLTGDNHITEIQSRKLDEFFDGEKLHLYITVEAAYCNHWLMLSAA